MTKINRFNSLENYASPKSVVLDANSMEMLCTSAFGSEGAAGSDGNIIGGDPTDPFNNF